MHKAVERKWRRRRDRLYIIAEILRIAKNGSLKTQLMSGAGLSFTQLIDYLSFLLSTRLLKTVQEGGKSLYKTTSKGLEFLTNYEKINSLLR